MFVPLMPIHQISQQDLQLGFKIKSKNLYYISIILNTFSYQISSDYYIGLPYRYNQTIMAGRHSFILDLLAISGAPVIIILTRQVE
jgi:hypothetical protein